MTLIIRILRKNIIAKAQIEERGRGRKAQELWHKNPVLCKPNVLCSKSHYVLNQYRKGESHITELDCHFKRHYLGDFSSHLQMRSAPEGC